MKKILLIIILITTHTTFAQKDDIDNLMIEANEAFNNSDFEKAKENYLLIIAKDSTYEDALFNLGATYLNLSKNDEACEQFQKAYSYGDIEAYDIIIQYCGELKYTDKVFQDHVDELPKFRYNGEFTQLIIRKNKYQKKINPEFVNFLKTEFKTSKNLKKLKKNFYIRLKSVTKEGELLAEIVGNIKDENKERILEILKNRTEYYPAIYHDKKVELFGGGFTLPVSVN